MGKHTLKILRCSHHMFSKYVWPFFNNTLKKAKDNLPTRKVYMTVSHFIYLVIKFQITICWKTLLNSFNTIKRTFYFIIFPAGNYMFKVTSKNNRTRYEICSKLTIKIPERRQWRRSRVFIVNFEHTLHFVLVFLLLILSR